jgi:gas vesicle protein
MIGFIIGMIVGGMIGVLAMAMVFAGQRADCMNNPSTDVE